MVHSQGPTAATIAYMGEWEWQVPELRRCTPLLLEAEISLQDPWWKIEKVLMAEAQNQRRSRLAQRQHHQHLITGLDWHVYRQMVKQLPAELRPHLKTWVQGAVQFREASQAKQCPICRAPATPKHILWLCKWHQGQGHAYATRMGGKNHAP